MDLDACITHGFHRINNGTIRRISKPMIKHCLMSAIAMNKGKKQLLVIFKEMNRLLNSTYGQEYFDIEKFKLFVHQCLAEKNYSRRASRLLKHGAS